MQRKMPERQPGDGEVRVQRYPGAIELTAVTAGKRESILMSEYNAWRILGLLSLMLELPLTKEAGRAIVLTERDAAKHK